MLTRLGPLATLFILTFCLGKPGFTQPLSPLQVISREKYKEVVKAKPEAKLVLLSDCLSPFEQKIYYCSSNNFTHQVLYDSSYQLYVSQAAARKLILVQDSLQKIGLNLLIFDGYRPYHVTQKMWELVKDKRYVADPAFGSGHNKGIAIDLTMVDLKTGELLEMPTGYDDFSDTAHHDFEYVTPTAAKNRALLKSIMEHFGFFALETEWWHYFLKDRADFPVYNISFKALNAAKF